LGWGSERTSEWLILPDHGALPIAAYEPTVAALVRLRSTDDAPLPPLVVAVHSEQRADRWQTMLVKICSTLREAALTACIDTWDKLPRQLRLVADVPFNENDSARSRRAPRELWRRLPQLPPRRVPQAAAESKDEPEGFDGIGLSTADVELLELIGRHPFLSLPEIEALRGRSARNRCNRLVKFGLVRRFTFLSGPAARRPRDLAALLDTTGCYATRGLELTRSGLDLLAANYGLPAHVLTRHLGLTIFGAPKRAKRRRRRRRGLVRILDHGRGVNRLYVRWVRDARRRRLHGGDDAVVQWRPAAACGRPLVRPDAFLLYRRAGGHYGAFIEYDRATERVPQYRRKFRALWEFYESGAYERAYDGFPAILMVATSKEAEDRAVRVLLRMGLGGSELPVLIATEDRIKRDPAGLLGPVWRGSDPTFTRRCDWPAMRPKALASGS